MSKFKFAIVCIVAYLFCVAAAPVNGEQTDNPLILGVFPYISANQMVAQLTPLVKRMEEAVGRRIIMVSAPNFKDYMARVTRGDYDLVITAPHMGRLSQKRDGWKLVVMSSQQTATLLLVRKGSGIEKIADLRGKKMAVGNWRSVTYQMAERALGNAGLVLGVDVEVVETATFSNVVQSVFIGEVEVGATPTLLWDKWMHVNRDQHQQLKEIFRASKPAPPSFLVMVAPGTAAVLIEALQKSLLAFNDTPEGKKFFADSQYESFLPPDQKAMELIDPYVHVLTE